MVGGRMIVLYVYERYISFSIPQRDMTGTSPPVRLISRSVQHSSKKLTISEKKLLTLLCWGRIYLFKVIIKTPERRH